MVGGPGQGGKSAGAWQVLRQAGGRLLPPKYAAGVYTSGVVFEPRFYEGFADDMRDADELPISTGSGSACIGNEGGMSATYGMEVFGKDEMEVLNTGAEPGELRDFLASLVSYVLEMMKNSRRGNHHGRLFGRR